MGKHAGVVTLDDDVMADLQELAGRHGCSVKVLANTALRNFIRHELATGDPLEVVRTRTTARLPTPTNELDED